MIVTIDLLLSFPINFRILLVIILLARTARNIRILHSRLLLRFYFLLALHRDLDY